MRLLTITTLLYLLINSCTEQKAYDFYFNNTLEKKLALDSVTIQSGQTQYFEDDNNKWVVYLNDQINRLYFYDYSTCKLDFIWKPKVKTVKLDGFQVINLDSIVCYSYHRDTVLIFNKDGNLTHSFSIKRMKNISKHPPQINITNVNPIFAFNKYFIFSGFIVDEYVDEGKGERPVGIRFNSENKSIEYFMDYPPVYSKKNWGGAQFRFVYATCNPVEKKILFSFPVEKNIFEYNVYNSTIREIIVENNLGHKLLPYCDDKNYELSREEYETYFKKSNSFGPIYYDRFTNIYYRFIFLKDKDYKWVPMKDFPIKVKLFAYDKNFRIIADTLLEDYNPARAFVSKDGLCLCKESKDEDNLAISIFNVKQRSK